MISGPRTALVWVAALACTAAACGRVQADALPFLPAGDVRLRHLVQIEADEGRVPLASAWPIPTLDLPEEERSTLYSLQQPGTSADAGWFAAAAAKPSQLRGFDATPREKGEVGVQGGWAAGDYAGGVMRMSFAVKPQDEMHYRFDDSYAAWRFGNWWASLGQQQRWWGPGWDGSLILSNNARPMPSIALDRAHAEPFQTKWLSWIGPWRISTFMGRFENRRVDFPHPLLWGFRGSFRPLKSIEIGLSRTAQWCRPGVCGLGTFKDVLLGHDNRGANVAKKREPGNQELAWDIRWKLPAVPAAFYYQINGETGEGGTVVPRPRQTTDLLGFEFWSSRDKVSSWRAYVEWVGTTCGEFSFDSSDQPHPGCQYNHDLFSGGYYFRGRVIGDSVQGDGRMLTLGGIYLDPVGRMWNFRLRRGTLNRFSDSRLNTLSPVRAGLWDVEAKLDGRWRALSLSLGIGAERLEPINAARTISGRVFLDVRAPWAL